MKCNANILARIVHWTTRFAVSWAIYVTCIIGFMLIFGELFLTIYSYYLEFQRNGVIATPKRRSILFFHLLLGSFSSLVKEPNWPLSSSRRKAHPKDLPTSFFKRSIVRSIYSTSSWHSWTTHLMPTKASDAIFTPNLSKVTNLSSHNEHVLSVWRRYATGTKGKRSKREHSNSLCGGQITLSINCVDKTKHWLATETTIRNGDHKRGHAKRMCCSKKYIFRKNCATLTS